MVTSAVPFNSDNEKPFFCKQKVKLAAKQPKIDNANKIASCAII